MHIFLWLVVNVLFATAAPWYSTFSRACARSSQKGAVGNLGNKGNHGNMTTLVIRVDTGKLVITPVIMVGLFI